MIPDFPHNIRIRLAQLIIFSRCTLTLLSLCPVGCLSLEKLNWDSQQGRDLATSGYNKKIVPILFLQYEESLVSSNLNSKNFGFMVWELTYILKKKSFYSAKYFSVKSKFFWTFQIQFFPFMCFLCSFMKSSSSKSSITLLTKYTLGKIWSCCRANFLHTMTLMVMC